MYTSASLLMLCHIFELWQVYSLMCAVCHTFGRKGQAGSGHQGNVMNLLCEPDDYCCFTRLHEPVARLFWIIHLFFFLENIDHRIRDQLACLTTHCHSLFHLFQRQPCLLPFASVSLLYACILSLSFKELLCISLLSHNQILHNQSLIRTTFSLSLDCLSVRNAASASQSKQFQKSLWIICMSDCSCGSVCLHGWGFYLFFFFFSFFFWCGTVCASYSIQHAVSSRYIRCWVPVWCQNRSMFNVQAGPNYWVPKAMPRDFKEVPLHGR